MIRSMTGFGRSQFEIEGAAFDVEIRSVNHRHLDTRVRLPRAMSDRESAVKACVQARLSRGKVDISVNAVGGRALTGEVSVDREVVAQYVTVGRELAAEHGLEGWLSPANVLSLNGVTRFVEPTLSEEALAAGLERAIGDALAAVDEMRLAEGRALEAEFQKRLATIEQLADFFHARAGEVLEATRERLRKRAEQLRQEVGLVDEARLHQEIVIAADRLDITEEIVRLRSHIEQFRTIMGEAGMADPVGRRLDFLLQEMGREANTIGSKANDAPLAHRVVELKTELERIREQVQNVE